MSGALLLLAMLTGCGAALSEEINIDRGADPTPTFNVANLMLDVLPPLGTRSDAGDLLSEMARTDGPLGADHYISVQLKTPVRAAGVVDGYVTTPWLGPSLPGEESQVTALVSLRKAGTLQSYNARTDPDSGRFHVQIVPDDGYQLTIVPDDPSLPFLIQDIDVRRDLDLSAFLAEGTAIFGTATDLDGLPLPGVQVRAIDAAYEVASAFTTTNGDGDYVLRVLAGSYRVEAKGRLGDALPVQASGELQVPATGQRHDFTFAHAGAASPVFGHINAERVVDEAVVRFTAIALDDYDPRRTSMMLEVRIDSRGNFSSRLLPGSWQVDVLPAVGERLSPRSVQIQVGGDELDIPDIELAELTPVTLWLEDENGFELDGAQVSCEERGFGGRFFTGITEEGELSLDLPTVAMDCTLTPPGERNDLALTRTALDPTASPRVELFVLAGVPVTGEVSITADEPVPFTVVELRDGLGRLWGSAFTDQDGRFDLRVALP